MVVEIPRWTDGKIEIKRTEPMNPIFHDDKDDLPRFVESVWPHKSYPFLYGSIPQTWESPNFNHDFTNFPGDNDPIDVFDIGLDPGYVGQIKQVKILGGLALADGEETDWKILAIDTNDTLAGLVNSLEDLEKYRPNLAQTFYDWFTVGWDTSKRLSSPNHSVHKQYYKVARGDDLIPIIGNAYQDAVFIEDVVAEGHGYWAELVAGTVDTGKINYNQTSDPLLKDSYVTACEVSGKLGIPHESNVLPAAAKPAKYDHWYYLDENRKLIEI
ncbi:inorganic pyrophosphatase [Microdochium trichocladiopsis]|uniref:inorganic diphosphatase n=1 Tax=Microdochium trichocladiopsis TaxID=1682393 RepID=A0A9P8YA44_9PEZI|nr:inorganic pyrophosphatase [Microdochium trichocladiopsis]KAH7035869.1 inorganic pyrophosphatase [Microdochium trichocladiopsis]